MRQEIINKLNEIEKKEHVKIIYASQEVVRGDLNLLIVIMMCVLFM